MTLYIDLDGTLLSVKEKYLQLYRTLLDRDEMAFDPFLFWELKRNKIGDAELLYVLGLQNIDFEKFSLDKKELIESESFLRFDSLNKQVFRTLEELSKRHKLIIVTLRRNRKNLMKQLTTLGILSFFSEVLSTDESLYQYRGWEQKVKLIKTLKSVSNSDYIIGDSDADVLCAKHLGIKSVAVLSGVRNYNLLSELSPDYTLASFSDINKILK